MALATAGGWFALFNLYQVYRWLPSSGSRSDFLLFYAVSTIGPRWGWQHLYDPDFQRRALAAVTPGTGYSLYVNPPPLNALLLPLTLLPPVPAQILWSGGCLAALVAAALLVSPGDRFSRAAFLASALGLLASYVALTWGTVAPLVVIALVAAWVALRSDRQVACGLLLLAAVDLKPNLAILVPFALLAAGWHRAFLTWAAGTVVVAAASAAVLGQHGVAAYLEQSRVLLSNSYAYRWSLVSVLGSGPAWWLAAGAVAGACLYAGWLWRGAEPGPAIAVGVIGSVLVNHHLTPGDLIVMLVPLWLVLRQAGPAWLQAVLLGGWLLLWLAVIVPAALLLLESVMLALLLVLGWQRLSPAKSEEYPAGGRGRGYRRSDQGLPLTQARASAKELKA